MLQIVTFCIDYQRQIAYFFIISSTEGGM